MPPPLMPFEVKRKAIQASMAQSAPQQEQQQQQQRQEGTSEAQSAASTSGSDMGTQPLTLGMQKQQQQRSRLGTPQQLQQWQRQHEQLRREQQQKQQQQQSRASSTTRAAAAAAATPAGATDGPAVRPQPSLGATTWATAAAQQFPELYDPTWHTSPFALFSDLWPTTAAAHEAGHMQQLSTKYYAFALRCLASSDVWVQLGAVLALLDTLEEEDALLAGCCAYLPRSLVQDLLLPLAEALLQPRHVLQELLGRAADAHPGVRLHRELPGTLDAAIRQLRWLRGIYPGMELSELTHVAGDHLPLWTS